MPPIRRDIYAGINPCRAFVGPIVSMSFCLLQEGYVILWAEYLAWSVGRPWILKG